MVLLKYFQFTDNVLDPVLAKAFVESPFASSCKDYVFEQHLIISPLYLDELISSEISKYDVKFCSCAVPDDIIKLISSLTNTEYQNVTILHKMLNEILKHKMSPEMLTQNETQEIYQQIKVHMLSNAKSITSKIHTLIAQSKSRVSTACSMNYNPPSIHKEFPVKSNMIAVYKNYMTEAHLSSATAKPSPHLGFAMTPYLSSISAKQELFGINPNDLLNITDVDYSESNIFSLPAVQYILGEKRNVFIFFSNDKIQVVSSTDTIRLISRNDISFIIQRKPNSIEIFLVDHESLYFNFEPLTTEDILENISRIDSNLVSQSSQLPSLLKSNISSNFESIVLTDLFANQSFHTPDKAPVVNIGDFKNVPYSSFCQCYDNKFDETVMNRLKLAKVELPGTTISLNAKKYDTTTIEREVTIKLGIKEEDIKSSIFFDSSIVVFQHDDTVRAYQICERTANPIFEHKLNISEQFIISATNKCVLVRDSAKLSLTMINESIRTVETSRVPDHFSSDSSLQLSVFNSCEVKTRNLDTLFPSKITCIAGSDRSAIFAVGTELCNVYVHSAVKPEFFGFIQMSSEAKDILVTDCFNVIAIDIDGAIAFYTACGEYIGTVNKKCETWCKFDILGLDYILFADNKHNIWCCMAGRPTEINFIGHTNETIRNISILQNPLRVCSFTSSGVIEVFPIHIVI